MIPLKFIWSLHVYCPQGEWRPSEISNPAYKGKWIHPEIDNPEYTADSEIYKYGSIGVIGLDLWQVRRFLIKIKKNNILKWEITLLFYSFYQNIQLKNFQQIIIL